MDTKALESFRNRLVERRLALAEQVRSVEADLESQAKAGADWSEAAQARSAEEVLANLEGEERHELDAIDAALARIEQGSYGTCSGCGSSISTARLEALPSASLCIECQENVEAEIGAMG